MPVLVAQTKLMPDDRTLSTIGTGFAIRVRTLHAPLGDRITQFNIGPRRVFAGMMSLYMRSDGEELIPFGQIVSPIEKGFAAEFERH